MKTRSGDKLLVYIYKSRYSRNDAKPNKSRQQSLVVLDHDLESRLSLAEIRSCDQECSYLGTGFSTLKVRP